MARPPKRSPERETAILNALRVGNTRRAATAAAEIHVDTLRDWMVGDPAFSAAVVKAEADAELRFLGQVAKAAAGNNWQAAAWWLERRQHIDYGRRDRIDMNLDMKGLAEKIAAEDGLDRDALLAEAERIIATK